VQRCLEHVSGEASSLEAPVVGPLRTLEMLPPVRDANGTDRTLRLTATDPDLASIGRELSLRVAERLSG